MDDDPREALPIPPEDRPPGPERTSGLAFETCYRHPDQPTGVHCTRCGRPICTECMNPAPVGYQCPECVAQARATAPRRRYRIRFFVGRPGWVTTTLLVVNVAMFLVEVVVGGPGALGGGPSSRKLFDLGALYPPAIALGHQYWRLFTVMFLHAGILHIAFNMYALYLFGYLVESAYGWPKFLAIYLVSGFLAGAASFAFGPILEVGVGASGAIFGLLGAWVAYNYRRRSLAAARAQLNWALMLIGLNLVLSFSIPGIDWRAHVGGLIAGIAAGTVAEGLGRGRNREIASVLGFVLLVAVGVALTAWRVATFPVAF